MNIPGTHFFYHRVAEKVGSFKNNCLGRWDDYESEFFVYIILEAISSKVLRRILQPRCHPIDLVLQ